MKRLILALCLLGPVTALADAAADIQRDVDKLVSLYTDGFGHTEPGWRHVVFGPVFEPHSRDAVVFFALAGMSLMNGREEYIAIFAQGEGRSTPIARERPYHLVASAQVGTRWARTLDWETARISSGQVVVRGSRWGGKDPGCCPTGAIEVVFSITTAEGGETRYPLLRETEKSIQPNRPEK